MGVRYSTRVFFSFHLWCSSLLQGPSLLAEHRAWNEVTSRTKNSICQVMPEYRTPLPVGVCIGPLVKWLRLFLETLLFRIMEGGSYLLFAKLASTSDCSRDALAAWVGMRAKCKVMSHPCFNAEGILRSFWRCSCSLDWIDSKMAVFFIFWWTNRLKHFESSNKGDT